VRLLDTQVVGKYEGVTHDGNLKINIGENIIYTTLDNIMVIDQPELEQGIQEYNHDTSSIEKQLEFKNSIDLHMEILAPEIQLSSPSRVLSFQVDACRKFIDDAIANKSKVIHIIHGKGEGILKQEVKHLLESNDKIKFIISSKSGGAVEVWLKDL